MMCKHKKIVLRLLLAFGAVSLSFISAHAQSEKKSKVTLPVSIPVTVIGTPNVNVVNPNPIPVSGNVAISGTPTVRLAPDSTTGVSGNVGVSNTEESPLFVRYGQKTALALSVLNNAVPSNGQPVLLSPAGGLDVSAYSQIRLVVGVGNPSSCLQVYVVGLSTPGPDGTKLYWDRLVFRPEDAVLGINSNRLVVTKLYDVPGTTLEIEVQAFGTDNSCPAAQMSLTIFGR